MSHFFIFLHFIFLYILYIFLDFPFSFIMKKKFFLRVAPLSARTPLLATRQMPNAFFRCDLHLPVEVCEAIQICLGLFPLVVWDVFRELRLELDVAYGGPLEGDVGHIRLSVDLHERAPLVDILLFFVRGPPLLLGHLALGNLLPIHCLHGNSLVTHHLSQNGYGII